MENPFLIIDSVSHSFNSAFGLSKRVISNINFQIKDDNKNDCISILAPFASGKTTLLKIISGLILPTAGEVILENKKIIKPGEKIVFIPAFSSSLPWLNVKQNVVLAFKINQIDYSIKKVKEILQLVELDGYENHFPDNQSIGFRFRISLARAIAVQPKLILIDDIFASMNAETKQESLELLKKISEKKLSTFVFATSSIQDAIFLSNNIILMSSSPSSVTDEIKIIKRDDEYIKSIQNEIEIKLNKKSIQ